MVGFKKPLNMNKSVLKTFSNFPMTNLQLPFFLFLEISFSTCTPALATEVTQGVPIYPSDNGQAIINANKPGTTYILQSGIHVQKTLKPKNGDTIFFQKGAKMRGSEVLAGPWIKDGNRQRWYINGIPYTTYDHLESNNDGNRSWMKSAVLGRGAWRSQELFVDGKRILHAQQLDKGGITGLDAIIGRRAWRYVDETQRVYIGFNPVFAGEIRLSRTMFAIHGVAKNVTIKNPYIFEYASPSNHGAINPGNGVWNASGVAEGWVIENADIHHIHGASIRLHKGWKVRRGKFHHNTQFGLFSESFDSNGTNWPEINDDIVSTGIELSECEIYGNNKWGFSNWGSGGMKFMQSGGTFHHNWIHDNRGTGVWFDVNNSGWEIHHNLIEDNDEIGLFYEISKNANIFQNLSRRNGVQPGRRENIWIWQAQFRLVSSQNIDLHHNIAEIPTVHDDGSHGEGPDGIINVRDSRDNHPIINTRIRDNRIVWTQSKGKYVHPRSGYGVSGDNSNLIPEFKGKSNTWSNNTIYYPGSIRDALFHSPSDPDSEGYVTVNHNKWKSKWGYGKGDIFHEFVQNSPLSPIPSEVPTWTDLFNVTTPDSNFEKKTSKRVSSVYD